MPSFLTDPKKRALTLAIIWTLVAVLSTAAYLLEWPHVGTGGVLQMIIAILVSIFFWITYFKPKTTDLKTDQEEKNDD